MAAVRPKYRFDHHPEPLYSLRRSLGHWIFKGRRNRPQGRHPRMERGTLGSGHLLCDAQSLFRRRAHVPSQGNAPVERGERTASATEQPGSLRRSAVRLRATFKSTEAFGRWRKGFDPKPRPFRNFCFELYQFPDSRRRIERFRKFEGARSVPLRL